MGDEIGRLLQREIDASRSDIDMRTRLVRALAAYNEEIRIARDRLCAEVIGAFGIGHKNPLRPSLDELQSVMTNWQARN